MPPESGAGDKSMTKLAKLVNAVTGVARKAVDVAKKSASKVAVAVGAATLAVGSAFGQSTDPADIVTSATGKYNTAVAVFIAAAVIGAAIMFIRKGLRGRM